MALLDFLKTNPIEPLFIQKGTGNDLLTPYAQQQAQVKNLPLPRLAPSAAAFFPKALKDTFGGTIKTLADLQSNPFNTKDVGINDAGKTFKQAGTSALGTLISSSADENKRAADFINTFKKPTSLSEKIGVGLKVLSGGANVLFSPISAVFAGADKLPVLGSIVKLVNLPFSVAGETGSKAADNALNALPIPQKTKDNIRQGVDEIGALAMQILVGKAGDIVMKNTLPSERATTAMRDAIIKDNPHLTDQISRVPTNTINSLAKDHGVTDAKTIITQAAEVARNKMQTKTLPSLAPAQKYGSAEEFVKGKKTESPLYAVGEGSGHTAPLRGEDVAPLYKLDEIYPKDIYSSDAGRLYSSGNKTADRKAIEIINKVKNNPNAEVTIYRAVPEGKDIKDFNKGDWITLTEDYAKQHGESNLGGKYKILSKKVKADEIFTDANSIQEFGYDPRSLTKSQLTDFYNQAKVSPLAQKAVRQPWNMTSDEFRKTVNQKQFLSSDVKRSDILRASNESYKIAKLHTEKIKSLIPKSEDVSNLSDKLGIDLYQSNHKYWVAKAIDDGKKIPVDILKEYPDLAKISTPAQKAVSEGKTVEEYIHKKTTAGITDIYNEILSSYKKELPTISDEILNKNTVNLIERLDNPKELANYLHDGNKISRKIFSDLTGLKWGKDINQTKIRNGTGSFLNTIFDKRNLTKSQLTKAFEEAKGAKKTNQGGTKEYPTMQEGVNAVARELQRRNPDIK